MKMNSDFNDYYDVILEHGTDPLVVYNRKKQTVEQSIISFPIAGYNFQ